MQLGDLAEKIAGRLQGDPNRTIAAVATLTEATPDDVSFLSDPRHAPAAAQTRAAAIIVSESFTGTSPADVLFVADVDQAVSIVLELFAPPLDVPPPGVDAGASVDPSAQIDPTAAIGPQAVIGAHARIEAQAVIGPGCVLGRDVVVGTASRLVANVVVGARCLIGANVIIHPNVTIGADGFGYRFADGRHHKISHIGIVVIEDDVEIGANSCVDRAKFGRTVIGRGAKIDNLVQIGHNVRIGAHVIVVSQAGIAGSCQIDDYAVLGGQVGVADHLHVGARAMIGAQSGLDRDVEPDAKIVGSPPRSVRAFYRENKLIAKLPEIDKELKRIAKVLESRGTSTNDS